MHGDRITDDPSDGLDLLEDPVDQLGAVPVVDRQLEVLREQVLDRARQLGERMPGERSGNRVTYSDGKTATFIPDYREYRRKMENRQVDILTTFNKQPPTPLSWRDREWLEKWLADNPLP